MMNDRSVTRSRNHRPIELAARSSDSAALSIVNDALSAGYSVCSAAVQLNKGLLNVIVRSLRDQPTVTRTSDRLIAQRHQPIARTRRVTNRRTYWRYVDYERMILVVSRVTDIDRALRPPRGAMWILMLRSAVSARRSASSNIC